MKNSSIIGAKEIAYGTSLISEWQLSDLRPVGAVVLIDRETLLYRHAHGQGGLCGIDSEEMATYISVT